MKFDVFISHSRLNKDLASHIFYNLLANGKDSWLDFAQLEVGEPLEEALRVGLRNSKAYLLLLSEESQASKFVSVELDEALKLRDSGELKIIVLKLDETEIPENLNTAFWIDAQGQNLTTALEVLMEDLTGNKALLDLTQRSFLGQGGYEKDLEGNNTWDLVLRQHILLAGQIRSLLHNPGKTAHEIVSTVNTLKDISIFHNLPFTQGLRTVSADGSIEFLHPVRMRIVPRIQVSGLPEMYLLEIVEQSEIHTIVKIRNKYSGEPVLVPVPFLIEFDAEL